MNVEKLKKFMDIARAVSALSKDRSRKVGVVILGPDNEIRSTGCNGFPRGIDDDLEERHERPEKYFWAEHGERNAIYNAARVGIPLQYCTILVAADICLCMDCARAIVQSGIKEVVVEKNYFHSSVPPWDEHGPKVLTLFGEAGISVLGLDPVGSIRNPLEKMTKLEYKKMMEMMGVFDL